MAVDYRKLRHLVTVAQVGSFSKAAQELHISQPALSRSIAVLEDHLGLRIFDRTSQGADLTNLGKLVVAEAEKLLQQMRLFEQNVDLLAGGESGKVGFGMWSLIGSLVLPSLSAHFINTRPQLIVQASVKPANALLKDLYDDEIELFFCGAGQFDATPDLDVAVLGAVYLSILVRKEHPLATRKTVCREDLFVQPKLCAVELSQIPDELMGSGVFVCDNFDILRSVALTTDSVWFAPWQLAQRELEEGELVSLTVADASDDSRIEIQQVQLKGAKITPAGQEVAHFVREYFKHLVAT